MNNKHWVFERLIFSVSAFTLFLSLLIAAACENKFEKIDYPTIMTLPVTNVSTEGVTFNVDILDMGSQGITEFGFIWSDYRFPDIDDDIRLLDIPARTGKYSARITSTIEEDKEYFVRSFIKTKDRIVYGNVLKFLSMGSQPPVITSFTPDTAGWRDTITIKGLNYSNVIYNNIVFIGDAQCQIASSNDTLIRAIVPQIITSLENSVRVEVAGGSSNIPEKKMILLKPTITDYQPRKVRWGDTLLIKGRKLKNVTILNNKVQLGSLVCSVNVNYSDSCIGIRIPYSLESISNALSLSINGFILTGAEPVELLSPYFDFSPKEGIYGTVVTLTGRFNTTISRNEVFFGTTQATISSVTATKMVVKIPNGVSQPEPNIIYKVNPFTFTSLESFKILSPQITSISPTTAAIGETITISGSNFLPGSEAVSVQIGNHSAQIESMTRDQIVVKVPVTIDSIPAPIRVSLGSVMVTSSDIFTLKPHEISSVNYSQFNVGSDVEIFGIGFNPQLNLNKVYIENTPLTLISGSNGELIARIDKPLPRYINRLVVEVGKYKRYYTLNETSTDPFALILMPAGFFNNYILNANRKNGLSFALNGKGYVFDRITNLISSYDPENQEVIHLNPNSQLSQHGITAITNNDTMFAIAKTYFAYYNVLSDEWKSFGIGPSGYLYGGGFSIGGRVYFGLVRNTAATNFSDVFQVYSKSEGKWINKAPFPLIEDTYVAASFAHNGIGYVLFANKKFYSYNPATDTWKALSVWPAVGTTRYGPTAFVINSQIYIGLGYSYNTDKSYNDIWTYNPGTDTWTQVANMPNEGRSSVVVFVVNQKAYLGFGTTPSKSLTDFYEFDPSLLK